MRLKYVIIADDLTGSNDTGVQFARYGLKTFVLPSPHKVEEKIEKIGKHADVLVFNTESRADSPDIAYEKCRNIATTLRRYDIEIVYKKVDSTMRGNIGAELDGVLDGFGREIAFFTSAFPLNNRIVIGGYLLVNGLPVNLTAFALDPVSPVKEANVLRIIRKQSERNIGLVEYSDVSQGVNTIREKVNELIKKRVNIIVFDVVSQEDLLNIAEAIKDYHRIAIYSGSAGLARELPKVFGETEKESEQRFSPRSGKVLMFSGSVNPLTLEQIEYAKKMLGAEIIDIDAGKILKDEEEELTRVTRLVSDVINSENDAIILKTVKSQSDVTVTWNIGKKLGLSPKEISVKIAHFLGILARNILNEHSREISGLILTGGDTAINVCESLNVVALEILDEIEPGVPIARAISETYKDLYIVTKAGGFGKENTIAKAIECLIKKN